MSRRRKVYVVWKGRRPGVYDSWDEARAQVEGFADARYKAYPSRAAAEAAFRRGLSAGQPPAWALVPHGPRTPALAVDAAAPGPQGPATYRGVALYPDGRTQEVFRVGPLPGLTANAGEFLALVHALRWLTQQGLDWPVYTDSRIARGWLTQGRARTRHRPQRGPGAQALRQAEAWLARHGIPRAVLPWDTRAWGEIPADFGHK